MYDYKFQFADEDSFNTFLDIVHDEELWCNSYRKEKSVVVISIFESTAEYLYKLIEEKGLKVLQ